ncbi:hypothetical protein FXO37_27957 [Capsicum annuum]|nr:hypothetical protein FXO37_27957 [Capsicum annuum]
MVTVFRFLASVITFILLFHDLGKTSSIFLTCLYNGITSPKQCSSFVMEIIHVYNQKYESGAAFWPDVHGRIIFALVFSQLSLLGLLSTKHSAQSAPFLIALPVLTISFHYFCKGRYEPAFTRYPLQEAKRKDTLERAKESNLNLNDYLQNAYLHPVFKGDDEDNDEDFNDKLESNDTVLVPTKRQSRGNTPAKSRMSVNSFTSFPDDIDHIH